MSTRIVQRLARIALDCPCACDRGLAVEAGKLDLGTLAGERSGTKLVEGGTALIKLFAQSPIYGLSYSAGAKMFEIQRMRSPLPGTAQQHRLGVAFSSLISMVAAHTVRIHSHGMHCNQRPRIGRIPLALIAVSHVRAVPCAATPMKWAHHPNLRKRPRTPAKGRGSVQRAIRRAFAASGTEALTSSAIYDWAHIRRGGDR